jgi:hypothetical protein
MAHGACHGCGNSFSECECNGHGDTRPNPFVDLEIGDDVRSCCKRIANGSWCYLEDGHNGDCQGANPVYGPLEERPAVWRRTKIRGSR